MTDGDARPRQDLEDLATLIEELVPPGGDVVEVIRLAARDMSQSPPGQVMKLIGRESM